MERILTKRTKTTFISGMLFGLLCHMFFLTNVLKNYDGVIQNGFGAGVTSGRWLLEWAGSYVKMLWGDYNIPWYGGILTIILLSISASIVVEIFDIQNTWAWILWPAIFMTFPTTASTLVFSNTSLFYAVAILLIVFGCYAETKWKFGWIIAVVFAACSMGIYQAYLPMMISIYLLIVIKKLLDDDTELVLIVKNACKYLAEIIASVVLYYLLLQYRLRHTGKVLSDYQGINDMGHSGIKNIGGAIKDAYTAFFSMLYKDYASLSNTAVIRLMRLVLLLISIVGLIYAICKLINKKHIFRAMLLILASLLLPLAYGSIHIMCPNSTIYTLMVYGQAYYYIYPIILVESFYDEGNAKKCIEKVCCSGIIVALLVSCLNFTYQINGAYTNMYYAGEQAKNYFGRMITRVQETPGFSTDKKWAFLGEKIQDPLYENPWSKTDFLLGGIGGDLLNIWSRAEYIEQFIGYSIPMASAEEIEGLEESLHVSDLEIYPNDGSIIISNQYAIICLDKNEGNSDE